MTTFPREYELEEYQIELMGSIKVLVDAWKSGDASATVELHKLINSFDYSILPYAVKNEFFVTSHKLKKYEENPYFAKLLYVDLIPSCKDGESKYDIGLAVDRRVTYGEKDYAARFLVKNRPSHELQVECWQNQQCILSESEGKTVDKCTDEYRSRHFFPERPVKKNLLALMEGLPCKGELDHFDEERCVIGDTKTTMNIHTFDPRWYTLQFGFYFVLVLKEMEAKLSDTAFETFRRKLHAECYVVDKFAPFSRSEKFIYTNATLQEQWPLIMDLLRKWKDSEDSGIWPFTLDLNNPQDRKRIYDSELWPHLQEWKDKMEPIYL